MAKKNILSKLIDSPESTESILAAAEKLEKEITGSGASQIEKVEPKIQPVIDDSEIQNVNVVEEQIFDVDYFFTQVTGKKIEYRPSLMSADFLDRLKYLSIVFDVPMKDIIYNICNYWWATHKEQIQKAVKKKKKDFI